MNVWLCGVTCVVVWCCMRVNIHITSHMLSCQNVLNEDTSVAAEQGLYPHNWGW